MNENTEFVTPSIIVQVLGQVDTVTISNTENNWDLPEL